LNKSFDSSLLLGLFSILGLGIVQVYSSSYIFATEMYQDGLYFVIRQLISMLIGISVMFIATKIPWKIWNQLFISLWILTSFALILTFIPGIGVKVGGAWRWINMGFTRFEPSELLKILVPWLVSFLFSHWNEPEHWSKKPHAWFIWILPFALLLAQPDFGTFALLTLVILITLFIVGFSWKYFVGLTLTLIPVFTFLIVRYPYRLKRVVGFLNPWADPSDSGFQLIQSLLSVRNGGFWGQGLGAGQGKLFFLPEAHTDFTLAVFAEETGFIGMSLLFLLYGFVFFKTFQIGLHIKNLQQRMFVLGVSFLFGLNSLFNMAVVLGVLPTKGLTLPFLSYGGSSLVCYCLAFGWVLNIERQQAEFS